MQLDAIISTILSAAAFLKKPVQDAASDSIKDLLDAARYYLKKKFGEGSDGADVLELALEKPDSEMRKGLLVEEAHAEGLEADPELPRLARKLSALLPSTPESPSQDVRVQGRANKVLVAGRDVITTERVVHRNTVAPDERHVTVAQREHLRALIAELAARLAGADGKPNFAAGHRMLQRRFEVLSYALIPRDQFASALQFLKQQNATHRSRLIGSKSIRSEARKENR